VLLVPGGARPLVRRIPVSKSLVQAAVGLVRMTRPPDGEAPDFIKEHVSWGAGPRASQYLVLGAKVLRPLVLTHRMVINFAAEAAGRTAADIVEELVHQAPWRS
jgi:MoxR-like ATPase